MTLQQFYNARPEDLFLEAELVESRNEARRLIEQGGLKIGGHTVIPGYKSFVLMLVNENPIVLQRGKKRRVELYLDGGDAVQVWPL